MIRLFGSFLNGEDEALHFVNEAKRRYLTGRAEHAATDSTWEAWSDEDFADNIREEFIDMVIYSTARLARRVAA